MKICYSLCKHLSITEVDQDILYKNGHCKPPHICRKYNKQILHGTFHPDLPRLKECKYKKD